MALKLVTAAGSLLLITSLVLGLGPEPFPFRASAKKPDYAVPGEPLPMGYERYHFGMTREEILDLIREDPSLRAWDADFIEGFEQEDWSVLSAVGPPDLDQVWFVFDDKNELWCVTLYFNPIRYSYLAISKTLKEKYGRPETLGQDSVIWQAGGVRLQLEKSLHLKYIDLARFKRVEDGFSPELESPDTKRYGIFEKL